MNRLFTLEAEGNAVTVEFLSRNINLEEDRLLFNDEFYAAIKDRDVILKGRGDAELYAYVSYWCVKKGCRSLSIFEYNLQKLIELYSAGDNTEYEIPDWYRITENRDEKILEIIQNKNVPDGQWAWNVIERQSHAFALCGKDKMLVLTGKGPMIFYSIMGASAAVSGFEEVMVSKPQENMLLRISGGSLLSRKKQKENGVMIGVLGDPNSGKSVFSHVLGCLLEQKINDRSVWVYDCDAAAPTSDWYIYGLQRAETEVDAERIKEDRKETKQKWSPELEEKVAGLMKNVKNNLSFIIADLPGGYHNDEKNIHERIPDEGRAKMLKVCDYFVVIRRADKLQVFDEWKAALAAYGLENRIVCEIVSSEPDSAPEVQNACVKENGLYFVEVTGLDRCNQRNLIVRNFTDGFAPFIEHLTGLKPSF